jgi:hypothetical protein
MIRLRRMSWMGHVAHRGAIRNAYKVMVGKSERKTTWEM